MVPSGPIAGEKNQHLLATFQTMLPVALIAERLLPLDTMIVPSRLVVKAKTVPPRETRHFSLPSAFTAKSSPSPDPIYAVPSVPIAGTGIGNQRPVANFHFRLPSGLIAYSSSGLLL